MNKARYLVVIKDGGEQCHHHHIDQIRGGKTKVQKRKTKSSSTFNLNKRAVKLN